MHGTCECIYVHASVQKMSTRSAPAVAMQPHQSVSIAGASAGPLGLTLSGTAGGLLYREPFRSTMSVPLLGASFVVT